MKGERKLTVEWVSLEALPNQYAQKMTFNTKLAQGTWALQGLQLQKVLPPTSVTFSRPKRQEERRQEGCRVPGINLEALVCWAMFSPNITECPPRTLVCEVGSIL